MANPDPHPIILPLLSLMAMHTTLSLASVGVEAITGTANRNTAVHKIRTKTFNLFVISFPPF